MLPWNLKGEIMQQLAKAPPLGCSIRDPHSKPGGLVVPKIETSSEPSSNSARSNADPLRVAVYLADQNPVRDRSLGITEMTRSLMGRFAAREDLHLTQVISASSHNQTDPQISTSRFPFRTDRTWGRLAADLFHPWLARSDVDVWYYPKGYVSQFATPAVPCVGTMHDAIVQHYADHYPGVRSRSNYRYWINNTQRSLKKLDRILTISKHAEQQLLSFCDRYQIRPPKLEVTYEGSLWESMRGESVAKEEMVVHLASTAPHKQTKRLLEMWKQLQDRQVDLPRLCLVGKLDPEATEIRDQLRDVTTLPPLQLQELQSLVARSMALLFPSEVEGFGLPALEAFYAGTPVCFVRGTSVEEIIPEAGRMGGFELNDLDSFAEAFDRVMHAPSDLIAAISDAMYERYATRRIAERVLDALRRTAHMSC